MSYAIVSARINEKDKKAFDSFCNDVGISVSSAINIFIKSVLRERKIPFPISSDPFYSESNMSFLREGIKELNEGKGVSHELIEGD